MSDTYPDAQPQSYECPRPDSISVDPFAVIPSPISSEQLATYQTEIAECIQQNSGYLREAVLALIEPVWLAIDEGDKILAKCRKTIELPVKRCLSENDRILRWVINDLQAYVANAVAENQIALNTLQTEIILGAAINTADGSQPQPDISCDNGVVAETEDAGNGLHLGDAGPSQETADASGTRSTGDGREMASGIDEAGIRRLIQSGRGSGAIPAGTCCDITIPDPRKINRQDLERINASMPPWTGTVDLVPPGIDPDVEPETLPPPEDF